MVGQGLGAAIPERAKQKEDVSYEEIADHSRKEHETTMLPKALRSKTSTLARDVQCYLAVRKHALRRLPGGRTWEGVDKIVMQLYCSRNKQIDTNGEERLATSFRYVFGAEFLEKYP